MESGISFLVVLQTCALSSENVWLVNSLLFCVSLYHLVVFETNSYLYSQSPTDRLHILSIDTFERDSSREKQVKFFDLSHDSLPFSLSPGQSHYIPMIFLPNEIHGRNDPHIQYRKSTSHDHQMQHENIDYVETGYNQHSNNENDVNNNNNNENTQLYDVVIKIGTSAGVVEAPFQASSIPSPYGLPPGLHFKGDLQKNREAGNHIRWEYDMFLKNPSSTQELRIIEYFTTESEFIKIVWRSEDYGDPYLGPMIVQPDKKIYIGTVVVTSENLIAYVASRQMSTKQNLNQDDLSPLIETGYVHIHTSDLDEKNQGGENVILLPIEVTLHGGHIAVYQERLSYIERKEIRQKQQQDQNQMSINHPYHSDSSTTATKIDIKNSSPTTPDPMKHHSTNTLVPNTNNTPEEANSKIENHQVSASAGFKTDAKDFQQLEKIAKEISATSAITFDPSVLNYGTLIRSDQAKPKGDTGNEIHIYETKDPIQVTMTNTQPHPHVFTRVYVEIHLLQSDGSSKSGAGKPAEIKMKVLNCNAVLKSGDLANVVVIPPLASLNVSVMLRCPWDKDLGNHSPETKFAGNTVLEVLSVEGVGMEVKNKMAFPCILQFLPGGIGFDLNNFYFPVSSGSSHKKNKKDQQQKPIVRNASLMNNFPTNITLKSLKLSEKECETWFSVENVDAYMDTVAQPNQTWDFLRDKITVTYKGNYSPTDILPLTKCSMVFETNIATHEIPLILHGNQVLISAAPKTLPSCKFQRANIGASFLEMKQCSKIWWKTSSLATKFLKYNPKLSSLLSFYASTYPAPLYFGNIPPDQTSRKSLYITNMNPIPITVVSEVASFDGLELSLGRTFVQVSDYIPDPAFWKDQHSFELPEFAWKNDVSFYEKADPRFRHGFHKYGMIEFYTDSNKPSDGFHSIRKSSSQKRNNSRENRGAMISIDSKYKRFLYHSSTSDPMSKWTIPPGGIARFDVHVRAPTEEYLKDNVNVFAIAGLQIETPTDKLDFMITFETLLERSRLMPSVNEEYLQMWDDSPNVVSVFNYSYPLSMRDRSFPDKMEKVLTMPSSFRPHRLPNSQLPVPETDPASVELFFQSNISYLYDLRSLESCSDWFTPVLELNNGTILGKDPTFVGHLFSTVSCKENNFFSCALSFLEYPLNIQPDGCGLESTNQTQMRSKRELLNLGIQHLSSAEEILTGGGLYYQAQKDNAIPPEDENNDETNTKDGSSNKLDVSTDQLRPQINDQNPDKVTFGATTIFKMDEMTGSSPPPPNLPPSAVTSIAENMIHHHNVHHQQPKRADNPFNELNSFISEEKLQRYEKAKQVWEQLSSHNLNKISSTISAKVSVRNPPSEKKDNKFVDPILVSIPVMSVETSLEVPVLNSLVDSTLDFSIRHIASVSQLYIPITNPVGIPVRLRIISVKDNPDIFVQFSPEETDTWWTGGNYWMSDTKGNLLCSSHNVTIKSGGGAHVSLINPSLQTNSALLVGCGKRCSLRTEQNTPADRVPMIGAVVSQDTVRNPSPVKASPAFSLGYHSLAEIEIQAYGKGLIGPVFFRPTGTGDFSTEVVIENSLTGAEKVKVQGHGAYEKVTFFHEDIEQRIGRPTLLFSGTSTLSSKGEPLPVEKHVTLANIGDLPVEIEKVYIGTSELMHFAMSKQDYLKKKKIEIYADKQKFYCQERGFRLIGCPDITPLEARYYNNYFITKLSEWAGSIFSLHSSLFSEESDATPSVNTTSISDEYDIYLEDGFTIDPNKEKIIRIQHNPDCSFRTMFVTLIVEYRNRNTPGSWNKEFKKKKMELLMGYDMSPSQIAYCRAVPTKSKSYSFNLIQVGMILRWILNKVFKHNIDNNSEDSANSTMSFFPVFIVYFLTVCYWFLLRSSNFDKYRTNLQTSNGRNLSHFGEGKSSDRELRDSGLNKNYWASSFRILAKCDPSSTELLAIGREQNKHILLASYKHMDISSKHPYCIQPNGEFVRERPNNKPSNSSNRVSSDSSRNVDRLPLTDVVYGNFEDSHDQESFVAPLGLDWKAAANRGIITHINKNWDWEVEETTLNGTSKVRDLIRKRIAESNTATRSNGLVGYGRDGTLGMHSSVVVDSKHDDEVESDEADDTLEDDFVASLVNSNKDYVSRKTVSGVGVASISSTSIQIQESHSSESFQVVGVKSENRSSTADNHVLRSTVSKKNVLSQNNKSKKIKQASKNSYADEKPIASNGKGDHLSSLIANKRKDKNAPMRNFKTDKFVHNQNFLKSTTPRNSKRHTNGQHTDYASRVKLSVAAATKMTDRTPNSSDVTPTLNNVHLSPKSCSSHSYVSKLSSLSSDGSPRNSASSKNGQQSNYTLDTAVKNSVNLNYESYLSLSPNSDGKKEDEALLQEIHSIPAISTSPYNMNNNKSLRPPPGLAPPPGFSADSPSDKSLNLNNNTDSNTGGISLMPMLPSMTSSPPTSNPSESKIMSIMESSGQIFPARSTFMVSSDPMRIESQNSSHLNEPQSAIGSELNNNLLGSINNTLGPGLRLSVDNMNNNNNNDLSSNYDAFGGNAGFNIENFLSGILSDTSSEQQQQQKINENMQFESVNDLNSPRDNMLGGLVGTQSQSTSTSSILSPWDTQNSSDDNNNNTTVAPNVGINHATVLSSISEHNVANASATREVSRAFAYGIAVGDENTSSNNDGSNSTTNSATESQDMDEDDFIEEDAFLSSLVGE